MRRCAPQESALRRQTRQARDKAGAGVMGARAWGAPRLHRAAGYVEHDMGPRMAAVLAAAAHKIDVDRRRSHRARNVAFGLLGLVGVVGITGMLVTRYRLSNAYIEEIEVTADVTEDPITRGSETTTGR